jgi:hypothetical protein
VIIEETAILEALQIANNGSEEDRVSFGRRVWLARHIATVRAEVNATLESLEYLVQLRQNEAVVIPRFALRNSAFIWGSPGQGFSTGEVVLPNASASKEVPSRVRSINFGALVRSCSSRTLRTTVACRLYIAINASAASRPLLA